jgi:hypothetical protein
MLYNPSIPSAIPTPTSSATGVIVRRRRLEPKLTGHTVARRLAGKSQAQRAALAATHHIQGVELYHLTVKQRAALYGVSTAYVHSALRLSSAERVRVRDKFRSLVEPKPVIQPTSKALADAWTTASASERAAFVDAVGVGAVWDTIEQVIA